MKPWQIKFETHLAQAGAPAVLSRDLLARMARSARGNLPVAGSSLSHWLKSAEARGRLQRVQRGLYLNGLRAPPGQLADATGWLRTDAVVSLNTVLGEAGVLNNPARVVTAVVPVDAGAPPPQLGRKHTVAGTFHFFGLPRRILEAGAARDRLQTDGGVEHARATPEKALLDWLYLAASPRSHRTWPVRGDMDLDLLDNKRLRKLARASGLDKALDDWLRLRR
ncbi:MAG TPA: hypothetical protein VNF46_02845 [Gammaproteobacteria bacterium]|nr:hypothetical protein [Gammaproteobacteria bacterium]